MVLGSRSVVNHQRPSRTSYQRTWQREGPNVHDDVEIESLEQFRISGVLSNKVMFSLEEL
ncbi:MAG: hypothetical protein NTV68_05385 [Methanomicrobiales archaeon]|nr:hypothetical protein [Methanomicrobiales archaeon]